MSELELRQRIHELVRGYVAECGKDLPGGVERGMPLVESTIGPDEISAVIDVLLDGRITMGPRVFGLEDAWSLWLAEKGVGAMRSLMVNSGSSANLLAMSALASPHVEGGLRPGDEVLVPAVGWSTTVYPIAQVGCVPVLVDVDLRTLNVNAEILEAAISERTRAIVVVHALGNPCPMDEIMDLAEKHGLFVLEDCCEAHGAEMNGRRVGTFGDLSSFSFYFSHHMTTGEGGMLSFHDVDRWHDVCVSLRAHGWIMGRIDHEDHAAANPEIDPRWLFVSPGYNLRSTDLTAAIGLVQLEKLDGYVENRERIRWSLLAELEAESDKLMFQESLDGARHSAFGFSLILRPGTGLDPRRFSDRLEEDRVETRPLLGGNLGRQPAMRHVPHRVAGELEAADLAHFHGLMIGIHPGQTEEQIAHGLAAIRRGCKGV